MKYELTSVDPNEYPAVVALWEASVRATHHFLKEEDIAYFKPLILNEYLAAVKLRAARDGDGQILGFLGVAENSIEMLFIHPTFRGQGIGSRLLQYALKEQGAAKVDVNEDNPEALGFYQNQGFEVTARSPLDGLGKPYPILHMELVTSE